MVEYLVMDVGNTLVPYTEAWALQRELHRAVVAATAADTVVLLEHQPVFTAGTRTVGAERPVDGTPVVDVDRGGKITWHGPGQLVGYPIVHLGEPLDVVRYVRDLEVALIGALAELGIRGHQVPGRSGVWVSTAGPDAKIAAIGVRVADGVAMHGFALNCSNSLQPYSRIVACGISDAGVTTISNELDRTVAPVDVLPTITEHLSRMFAARARIGVAA
ncbi:MAG: lipB [Glaciihabitans sp.]|nr:lipB [Glaciihabitans sp.]